MAACLDQTLIHRYGLVRIIATLPGEEVDSILPKVLSMRRKTAVVAESVSAELRELAADTSRVGWMNLKGLAAIQRSAHEAEKRVSQSGLQTPDGRQPEPIPLAPQPVKRGKAVQFVDRPRHDWHNEYLELETKYKKREIENPPRRMNIHDVAANPAYAQYKRLVDLRRRLLYENREFMSLTNLQERQIEIEEKEDALVRSLKEPSPDVDAIVKDAGDLQQLKQECYTDLSRTGGKTQSVFATYKDERNALSGRHSADNSPLLLWDRRPYEPLHVNAEEFYPHVPSSIVDFQPNPNSQIMVSQRHHQKIKDDKGHQALLQTFLHIAGSFTTHGAKPVDWILRLMFPSRDMGDLVQAVPSLSAHATPKIIAMTNSSEKLSITRISTKTDKKNKETILKRGLLDYDDDCLSNTPLRALPVSTIWDLAVEWANWPDKPHSDVDMARALGGGNLKELERQKYR